MGTPVAKMRHSCALRSNASRLYFERPIVNKELTLWQHALAALGRGESCMLLLVVESIGSSPGRAGFKALVTSDGELHGSIGGGSMEHKLVELARARLAGAAAGSSSSDPAATPARGRDPDGAIFLKRQIHRTEAPADRSGMICSGEQTVAFYPLGEKDVQLLGQVIASLGDPSGSALEFNEAGFSLHASIGGGMQFIRTSTLQWTYKEPLDEKPRIIILGAGHVGLALSRTMDQLGFHVHLIDDRAGLNTLALNQWAHARSVVNYQCIGDVITGDPELYIVLVSFGYRTDALLARQLLRKKFKYLGMMGSAGKIKKLLADMRADGFTEEELARLRTPIGLPIHSRTPEEIAVSIAAEIIGVKNEAL